MWPPVNRSRQKERIRKASPQMLRRAGQSEACFHFWIQKLRFAKLEFVIRSVQDARAAGKWIFLVPVAVRDLNDASGRDSEHARTKNENSNIDTHIHEILQKPDP